MSDTFFKTGSAPLTVTAPLAFFDQVSVEAGELKLVSYSSEILYSLADAPGVVLTLGVNGSPSSFPARGLSGGGANGGIVQPDNIAGTKILFLTGDGGSFAGSLRDNGAGILDLSSSGVQEFTAANTYSGASTVSRGTLTFSGNGAALNSAFAITGGRLLLDNTITNLADRISDTLPISIAGTLSLRGNGAAPATETLGPLRSSGARGTIDILPDSAQPAAFIFDSLAPRTASEGGIPYFQGPGLGSGVGPGVASVRFTNAPALVGGGGGDGTTNISIVPAALASGVSGTTFVTYGTNGIRPLADAEYSGDFSGAGVFGNVSIGAATDIAGQATVNVLRLKAGGTVGGAGTLTVGGGMILAQPGSGPITVGALDFGGAEGIITTEGDFTISSSILGTGTGNSLTKSGAGRLTLTGSSNYTGATNVVGGILAIANPLALGDAASAVTVQSGAALDLLGGIVVNSKMLTLTGSGPDGVGSLRSRTGANFWNGPVVLQSVTLSVESGSLTFGGIVVLRGPLIKTGAGSLIFGGGTDGSSFVNITIRGGPLVSHASSGVPFTRGGLVLYGTPVSFSPAGTGADVALTEGELAFSPGIISFNQGSTTLLLDKGTNNTLTLNVGGSPAATVFARDGKATLVIAASGGISALGVSERLKSPFGVPFANGIVSPAIVGQDNDANRSGDFLSYNLSAGLRRTASYSASTTLQSAGSTAVFHATTPQTLTANAAVYALKNSGQIINLNGRALTLGGTAGVPAGLILNGGSITGGAILVTSSIPELAIYTSLAGACITSNIIASASPLGCEITKFGPGFLSLSENLKGSLTINSGGVQIGGTFSGRITLFGDGILSGTGKTSSTISGGRISPGNGAGILTAAKMAASASSSSSSPLSFTASAFEFTSLGAPTFNTPAASGNDVLRLTDPTAPFISSLTADNEIAVYFNLTNGVHLGDTFFGGFFTDKNAPFGGSILGALWRVFLADPLGDVDFNGTKYRASTDSLAVSTVPQTANFGAGM